MRALLKKSAQCLLCAALVMALCPAMAFAQDSPTAQGVNPIMRLFKAPETISASGNSAGTGAIPEQTPVYSIYDANYDGLTAQESIPRSYSSVEKGRVTPVGNQGDLGICWAFSTIAAAESSILSEGLASSVDLSERHLAYFTYHRQADPLAGQRGIRLRLRMLDIRRRLRVRATCILPRAETTRSPFTHLHRGLEPPMRAALPSANSLIAMNRLTGHCPKSSERLPWRSSSPTRRSTAPLPTMTPTIWKTAT